MAKVSDLIRARGRREFAEGLVFGAGILAAILSVAAIAGSSGGGPKRGELVAKERCAGCHGGAGRAAIQPLRTGIPALAGQNAAAISKQLLDFRSGARIHAQMTAIASGLDRADIETVAAYYSSVFGMDGSLGPRGSDASTIAQFGDSRRQLPACVACHAQRGAGSAETPRLAGQSRDYLLAQLNAFASGQRTNDAAGKMRSIAAKLTPQERARIADISNHWHPRSRRSDCRSNRIGRSLQ